MNLQALQFQIAYDLEKTAALDKKTITAFENVHNCKTIIHNDFLKKLELNANINKDYSLAILPDETTVFRHRNAKIKNIFLSVSPYANTRRNYMELITSKCRSHKATHFSIGLNHLGELEILQHIDTNFACDSNVKYSDSTISIDICGINSDNTEGIKLVAEFIEKLHQLYNLNKNVLNNFETLKNKELDQFSVINQLNISKSYFADKVNLIQPIISAIIQELI